MKKLIIFVLTVAVVFLFLVALCDIVKVHVDCNWGKLQKIASGSEIAPLATIAETGEPISSEPGGPWSGPTD